MSTAATILNPTFHPTPASPDAINYPELNQRVMVGKDPYRVSSVDDFHVELTAIVEPGEDADTLYFEDGDQRANFDDFTRLTGMPKPERFGRCFSGYED